MPVATAVLAGSAAAGGLPLAWFISRLRRPRPEEEDIAPPPLKPRHADDPRCEVLGTEPLMGQDKWLGGVASLDGKYIYGVPGKSKRVLRIELATGKVDLIGGPFEGPFKWLRGAECPADGCLYCMPSNADTVLCIDPSTQEMKTLGGPLLGDWKWHGGNLGNDGNIYGIPANAEQVLKVDTKTKEVSFFGRHFEGRQKWYGGLKSTTGAIYGIPQNASRVLKIVPETGETTTIGPDLGEGGWKYHGGVIAGDGSLIYGIPCNADSVLKIDSKTDTVTTIGSNLKSGRHRDDDKYKYLGGGVGADGKVYFFPSDAERVCCVDPATDEVKLVGPIFLEGMNKWQNGFSARDGAVYAIPQRAHGVLRINPAPEGSGRDAEVTTLDCGIDAEMRDKCEGGVLGSDGCIYCIPLRAKHVLKIIPGQTRAK
eukprot:TRINITY_DN8819_c0_g1_i2.p1 TRINITY_DN8819_c0_g1~~TRINITY_DN8819_c0_g1_i2.p1  ORF type:complete len:426 (-),score=72.08 TRINITY_DN8819_c0_g1_i2:66-1343(-)